MSGSVLLVSFCAWVSGRPGVAVRYPYRSKPAAVSGFVRGSWPQATDDSSRLLIRTLSWTPTRGVGGRLVPAGERAVGGCRRAPGNQGGHGDHADADGPEDAVLLDYVHSFLLCAGRGRPVPCDSRRRSRPTGSHRLNRGRRGGERSPRSTQRTGPGAPTAPPPYGGSASGEREGGGHERVGRHAPRCRRCPTAPGRRRSCSASARCCWSAPAARSPRSTAASSSGCCSSCSPARRPGSPCGAARSGLRSSEEVLAACAAGLAVAGAPQGGPASTATRSPPCCSPPPSWCCTVSPRRRPRGRWSPGRPSSSAVLRSLDLVPDGLHTELYLCVALLGLGIALFGRRVVGRLALITTGPWWLAGVVGGSSSAWADDGGRQWFSATLMIAAALRAAAGPAARAPGAVARAADARAGRRRRRRRGRGHRRVLLARPAVDDVHRLRRGAPRHPRRGLPDRLAPRPVPAGRARRRHRHGRACAWSSWSPAQRWGELALLLLLTAIPTALVAARRPDERPVALPTAVGCLAGAVLLALPDAAARPGHRRAAAHAVLRRRDGARLGAGRHRRARRRRRPPRRLRAGRGAPADRQRTARGTRPRPRRAGAEHAGLGLAHRTTAPDGGRRRGLPRRLAGRRRAARVRRLGRRRHGRACRGRVVLAARSGRAARSPPDRSCGTARPGRRGARACSWRPCPRRSWPSPRRTARGPSGCWSSPRWSWSSGARTGIRALLMVGAGTVAGPGARLQPCARCPGRWAPRWSSAPSCSRSGCVRERRPVAGFGRRLADLR